jgi:Helicase conserved C-terminal domain
MPLPDPADWSDLLRQALGRYDEPLLRQVSAKLVRTRNQWPAEELIDRAAATVVNAAVIDRRLQDLDPASRQLLTLIAQSRQPRWRLGNLVELVVALGQHEEPFKPILTLFEDGLLYPEPAALGSASRLKSFEQVLGLASNGGLSVFAHPAVAARALSGDLGLPELPAKSQAAAAVREADGLEWPLRLSALWQLVGAAPLRRTQGGAFFKRDLDRLRGDVVLNGAPADSLADLPDPALLAVALAEVEGIVRDSDGELGAGPLPSSWIDGLPRALESLCAGLFRMESWDPLDGFRMATEGIGNPFPSAYLLILAMLGRQPADAFVSPDDLEVWLLENHPYWAQEDARPSRRRSWVGTFVLGLLFPLRLVQAAKDEAGAWAVRLSPLGRWLLGQGELPAVTPAFPQTLLVQPNLEILAYRQGLTPALIARLAHFAAWKGLGAACLLRLEPDTVYRALEAGFTFETILQTLEQHGTRATPAPVIDSLRTWANKRDRITIYPAAALLEFGSAEDLNEALARGVPAVRLGDRLALVPHDDAIDFKHFRLTGTRDYALPPEKCVTVESDGVTLSIDLSRSDLLLETELPRFAAPLDRALANGRRQYRLTPASLGAAREGGMSVPQLEAWFAQRTGGHLSPAARLLLAGAQAPTPQIRRHLVLHVASSELADGLVQWPETRALIEERLGPTTLAVTEENIAALREQLTRLGMALAEPGAP